MLLNYFHEYAILLHPNFSVLTVDRASPLSMKRSWGRVGGCTPSQPMIAAQLLGQPAKIEPYTIIIMYKGCFEIPTESQFILIKGLLWKK
jgi:hypothetical protein